MALSAKLQVRQTQTLVITPQLMQAIRLLQMSGLELERFIAAEVEQNPLLEQDERDEAAGDEGETSSSELPALNDADPADAEPGDRFPGELGQDAGWTSAATPRAAGALPESDEFGIEQSLAAR